ncbi:MAG: hypothetical protein ACOZNI_31685 [Myxococcota bacterium]
MPRHEPVSPEEDLAAFYGGNDPVAPTGAPPPAGAPVPEEPLGAEPAVAEPAAGPKPLKPVIRPLPPSLNQPPAPPAEPPNAMVAALLSFVIPGLGQLYLGQPAKGAVLVGIGLVTGCGVGSFGILNLVVAIDAYLLAERKGRGEALAPWQFF